jgi:two-component system NarL family sensor kinase
MFAGLGIGIFRYRLYDIDRLLNRTLVYSLLTASLAAAYAAGVLVLGGMASGGRGSSLVVAAITLAVVDPAVQPTKASLWLRPAGRPGDARS